LAGLDLPSEGSVSLNGQNITAMDEEGRAAVRARTVALCFSRFTCCPA
jgi:putative ABC transport system ATP-binding protein